MVESVTWALLGLAGAAIGAGVYVLLRIRQMEDELRKAVSGAPAKKLADIDVFMTALRDEFSLLEQFVTKEHDSWKRESASLRTWVARKVGAVEGSSSSPDGIPDKITAEEAARMAQGEGSNVSEGQNADKRRIRDAYYKARGHL